MTWSPTANGKQEFFGGGNGSGNGTTQAGHELVVRAEEVSLVVLVLILWVVAIVLFVHR